MIRSIRPTSIVLCVVLVGCERRADVSPAPASSALVSASAAPSAPAPQVVTTVAAPASSPPPVVSARPPDAGAAAASGACRVLRGPIELPVRAPATLVVKGGEVHAILDDDGKPRVVTFPAPAPRPSSPASREPVAGGVSGSSRVACAVAADWIYCPDRKGDVHRVSAAGVERIVASSRSGTPVAAAAIGGTHAALAYLASRKTTEGWVSEAWLACDDDVPLRLSEDGSGATSVALVPRASSVVALTVDARSALTALHARPVHYEKRIGLGEDSVVFVGGPGDHRTGAALAVPPSGPSWALLPIARDVGSFGLAIVQVDDPPRVDEPVIWSMYPNGLDPAPIAAASGGRSWVARVRPRESDPASQKVLELGEIDSAGAFAPKDTVPTLGTPTDVSIVVDAQGVLWVSWLDPSGSWLERLACR